MLNFKPAPPLLILLILSACGTKEGGFPSLERRSYETEAPISTPIESAAAPSLLSGEFAAKADALRARHMAAHAAYIGALAAVQEAIDVAKASGIALSVTDPEQAWIKAAAGLPPEFKASMLQSLEKGSITEVDYVNGSVVRWGQKCGVPTPVNRTLVACLKGIERGLPA